MSSAPAAAPVLAEAEAAAIRALAPLLQEAADVKRIRDAGSPSPLAERWFGEAWGAIAEGVPAVQVARRTCARAVAAARLGAIDAATLRNAGLADGVVASVLREAVEDAGSALEPAWRETLAGEAARDATTAAEDVRPTFVAALAAQPRAGATRPGRPRLMLFPTESHAEHCLAVAVFAGLLAPSLGADPGEPFLAGLAHHLHNARLPDAGWAGEELLGDALDTVVATLTERALAELGHGPATEVRRALTLTRPDATGPGARSFQAADVLDRVLEMRRHARAASFTVDEALQDLELVHPGPLQGFGLAVVREAGLR